MPNQAPHKYLLCHFAACARVAVLEWDEIVVRGKVEHIPARRKVQSHGHVLVSTL